MKERGMIFNGEMVRAILDGRKTQTRRIMKVQPVLNGSFYEVYGAGWVRSMKSVPAIPGHSLASNCPFGLVGDRIWVRETWGVVSHELDEDGRIQPWNPDRPATAIHEMPFGSGYYTGHAIYAADGDFTWGDDDAKSEGITPPSGGVLPGWEYRINFRDLWMSIYGADNWEANPWVWVIEFKVVPNVPVNSKRSDLR